jgi:hypothetical protein
VSAIRGAAQALVTSRAIAFNHAQYPNANSSPNSSINFTQQQLEQLQLHTQETNHAPQPYGGMGWFVRRIDLDLEVEPSMPLNEELLRGLATILSLCPNLEIFCDHAHPGPAFDEQFVIYLPDGLLSHLFHPANRLRRVDWSANNLIPFTSYLHAAPYLEYLNLHHFVPNPVTWLSINHATNVSLPNLQSLVLKEDPSTGQAAILSTWNLPRLQMLRLEVAPDVGAADLFLRIHGLKIKTLSIHTPPTTINRPLQSMGYYAAYTPNVESLYFQLHHPPFGLNTLLPNLWMIGIHGLLNFRGRSFDDGEEEQLHHHLTAMVRTRNRMPALKVIRLVDFDPESWNSEDRTAKEVARWQRWQLRWEMLGVRWEDRDGHLMKVPNSLLELLEQRDLDDETIYSDQEMAVDEEIEGFSDYLSLSSASGMWE